MTIRFLKAADGLLISERYIRTLSLGVSFDDLKTKVWHVSYSATASRTGQTTASQADVAIFLKDPS